MFDSGAQEVISVFAVALAAQILLTGSVYRLYKKEPEQCLLKLFASLFIGTFFPTTAMNFAVSYCERSEVLQGQAVLFVMKSIGEIAVIFNGLFIVLACLFLFCTPLIKGLEFMVDNLIDACSLEIAF